ncbi:hypothetical protein VTO42DRAFT_6303 [Malbranchea cinnamomea]
MRMSSSSVPPRYPSRPGHPRIVRPAWCWHVPHQPTPPSPCLPEGWQPCSQTGPAFRDPTHGVLQKRGSTIPDGRHSQHRKLLLPPPVLKWGISEHLPKEPQAFYPSSDIAVDHPRQNLLFVPSTFSSSSSSPVAHSQRALCSLCLTVLSFRPWSHHHALFLSGPSETLLSSRTASTTGSPAVRCGF